MRGEGRPAALKKKWNLFDGNTSLLYKLDPSNPYATTFVDASSALSLAYWTPTGFWDTSGDPTQITGQFLATRAFALTSISRNTIVVGKAFYSETQTQQDETLVHEALHAYTGKGDIDLAAALGLGTFDSALAAGTAIDNYLKADRKKQ